MRGLEQKREKEISQLENVNMQLQRYNCHNNTITTITNTNTNTNTNIITITTIATITLGITTTPCKIWITSTILSRKKRLLRRKEKELERQVGKFLSYIKFLSC